MKKLICIISILTVFVGTGVFSPVNASEVSAYKEGTYSVGASLSCFVNAMGGVEFGAPMLSGATITVKNGKPTMNLTFNTATVTIYGSTAGTYFSPDGKTGYHDKNGSFTTSGVDISTASGTLCDTSVTYISAMSFPIDQVSSQYNLGLAIMSVGGMGGAPTQFGAGGNYDAILYVDWSGIPEADKSDDSEKNSTSDKSNSSTSSTEGTGKKTETASKTDTSTSTNADKTTVKSKGSETGTEAEAEADVDVETSVEDAETDNDTVVKDEEEKKLEKTDADVDATDEAEDADTSKEEGEAAADEEQKQGGFIPVILVAIAAIAGVVVYKKKKK